MDDFNTIRLKRKTIVKFKEYSKKVSPSYSETIEYMIAFFEDNDLSPFDVLGENMTSSTNRINKRMDAVATILKNMEKTQLIPTRELLESLFKEEEEKQ
ncbi:MAG: BfmA/BtgA family mobilization protein, partial [Aureibaculum sp.]|nr:BfmA/BtgA family mobilization protein [Aureibaculum sp.]